eukprot:Skav209976  [mRNA]  locus=scaffold1046:8955:10073:- [translate_table: standard]
MSKCAGLVYDILDYAPNTKLASSKVKAALKDMIRNKSLHVPCVPGNVDGILDRIDLSLRLVLNMFREAAVKPHVTSKVFRSLPREEAQRVQMAIDKVQLQGIDALQDESQESLNMVPLPDEASQGLPAWSQQLLPLEDKKEDPGENAAGPTQQTSLRRLKALNTSSFESLAPAPSIFNRILNNKSSSDAPLKTEHAQGAAMSSKPTANELLQSAMNFAPKQVGQKQPVPKAKAGAKQSKHNIKKKPAAKAKSKSKKASVEKAPVLKPQAKKVKGKAKGNDKGKCKGSGKGKGKGTPSAGNSETKCPEYKVEADPTPEDSYRNLYTSRHYNAAKALALRFGLPRERANAKGREAAAVASAKWDAYHAEPVDVD